ncbi:unnamed protein product [Microthlaspi erraticum]|uniref:Uncharacterized protein n=1 Tax=Microthlaspi erraticum TaxID=1685480 RepID=A0A6D2IRY9_9BRAS|nr:unnamed protein product [Microthlaspi erraticum]
MWWPTIGTQCHRRDHVMQEDGGRMASRDRCFDSYAIEFSGMEDKILPLLKYSYDNLKGEGIIDGSEGIERAENKGYEIIGDLVRASLLMEEAE